MTTPWCEIVDDAVVLRRALHEHPEVAWEEEWTAGRVRAVLDAMGVSWRPCAGTGTVARLDGGGRGPAIALRADIDGLPLCEASDRAWASKRDGFMHACGHDGHTATLIAAARWLSEHRTRLPGPVTLLFQPAEEGGHGAREMIRDGALDGVTRVFGWHNWPAIPMGRAVCPDGVVMAANGTFEIVVRGRGGHASQPEAVRDPILAAAAVVSGLQQIVSRRLPPQAAVVLSVTVMRGGQSPTIVPESVRLAGSFRLADDAFRSTVTALIGDISVGIARSHGCAAEVTVAPRYGVTENAPVAAGLLRSALVEVLGDGALARDVRVPIMASEDFGYYAREVPSAFALVGAGEPGGTTPPCHSPHYDFDDRLIPVMARVLVRASGLPVPSPTTQTRHGTETP